jgi:hypothetical protein
MIDFRRPSALMTWMLSTFCPRSFYAALAVRFGGIMNGIGSGISRGLSIDKPILSLTRR